MIDTTEPSPCVSPLCFTLVFYNQKATNFTYDELGRTIITTMPFENTVKSQTKQYYDNNGNVVKTMQQSNAVGSATTWDTTEYSYDSRNRLLWTKTIPEANTNNYVQYKYDNVGNVTKVFTGLTALIDVNSTEIPEGCAVTSYEYDLFNRVTSIIDPYEKAETFTYDNAGNVLTKTDRNGTVTTTTYNAFNQPLSVTAVNGTEQLTTTYAYDTMGNVRSAAQNGQSITYSYNNKNQLTSEQYGNTKVEYTYTSDNRNIATMKAYNGTALLQDLSYTYNSLDLLTKVTGEKITTYQYDYNGRLVREITDDKKSVDYEYNDMGLIKYVYNTYEDNHYWDYEYTYYLNGEHKGTVLLC